MTMDLKEYAVLRKLTANSELLNYVVNNKPVPVPLLETDIVELIKDLKDKDISLLVSNPKAYLRENVRVSFKPQGKGQYEVVGDIADPVIESIEVLNKSDRSELVTELIDNMMKDLNPEREFDISNVQLTDEAESFVAMTSNSIFSPSKPDVNENADDIGVIPEASDVLATVPDVPDVPDVPAVPDELTDDELSALSDGVSTDFEPEVYPEAEPVAEPVAEPDDGIDLGFMSDALPDTTVGVTEPLFETPEGEIFDANAGLELDNPISQTNEYKNAYNFLVDKIKDMQIDQRLPGLHLA